MKEKDTSQCGRTYTVIKDGKKMKMTYEEVCHDLGFIAKCEFVKITTRGTITFTAGTPNDVQSLYQKVNICGYKAAKSLSKYFVSGYFIY